MQFKTSHVFLCVHELTLSIAVNILQLKFGKTDKPQLRILYNILY